MSAGNKVSARVEMCVGGPVCSTKRYVQRELATGCGSQCNREPETQRTVACTFMPLVMFMRPPEAETQWNSTSKAWFLICSGIKSTGAASMKLLFMLLKSSMGATSRISVTLLHAVLSVLAFVTTLKLSLS